MQTRKHSIKEAVVNTFIGWLSTLIFSYPIYWVCGVKCNGWQLNSVVLCFTALSVVRNYVIRRWFNKR